jgi:hypothetical protein
LLFVADSVQLIQRALEGFGDFKIGGQAIHTVKYADHLVLLAREEKLLQGMVDRLSETGKRYGMEMNVEKTKVMRISRQPSLINIMIDQKQLENVEYFNYLGNMIKNDARCTREIKSRIAMAKAAFNKKKSLFTSKLDLSLRKKLVKCYIWSIALYGTETWTLRKIDLKYLESFEIWCWRIMEEIRCIDCVRNEEVLHRVKDERNILHSIKRRKANLIDHILCRNCLLKHVIEGKLEGRIEMVGRRCKQLLDDLKEKRRYWKLKAEALDRTLWRTHFRRGYGPVVRQTTE